MCANVSRYSSRRLAVGAAAEPGGELVDVGRRQVRRSRTRAARSTIVAGRRPPSRWSWSSALGACADRVERQHRSAGWYAPRRWQRGTRRVHRSYRPMEAVGVGRTLAAMSPVGTVLCPILVGRDDLLSWPTADRRRGAGRGHALFLSGQAGLGKTRLMRGRAAEGRGARASRSTAVPSRRRISRSRSRSIRELATGHPRRQGVRQPVARSPRDRRPARRRRPRGAPAHRARDRRSDPRGDRSADLPRLHGPPLDRRDEPRGHRRARSARARQAAAASSATTARTSSRSTRSTASGGRGCSASATREEVKLGA